MNTRFHTTTEFVKTIFITRFDARPDTARPGFYANVLVIEKGFAKGHYAVKDGTRVVNFDPENPSHSTLQKYPITITDLTLQDIVQCGNAADDGETKCKLDHGSSVLSIVGNYNNFRLDGNTVRADLTLDSQFEKYNHAIALIKNCAKKIGNSIDFDYSYDIDGNVAVARCRKLNSVDIVDSPAATKSLFNEPNQNNNTDYMPLTQQDLDAIGTLVDTKLAATKTELGTRFDEINTKIAKFEEGEKETDEEKDEEKEALSKKGNEGTQLSAKQIGEIAGKAALAAVTAAMPKTPPFNPNNEGTKPANDGKTAFEAHVEQHMALGTPKGIAIQRAAKDHKADYNAHFKLKGSTVL